MARISFVCPIYNKAAYLPGVIAALGRQAPSHERQFIFIDDGSSDGSLEIVRDLTRGWPNCEYRYQENQGPARATNAGFALAEGDFIKLLGSDDILAPHATDILLQAIEIAGAVAVYSRQSYYDKAQDIVFSPVPERLEPQVLEDAIGYAVRPGLAGTSQTLFRAQTVRAVGGCDERVFVEDYSLTLRLALAGPIALLPLVTAYGPAEDPSRLMVGLRHQALHDYTLTLALFLADHPALERKYGREALRVAAGRAEKWARREVGNDTLRRRYRWLRFSTYLPLSRRSYVPLMLSTLDPFHEGAFALRKAIVRKTAEAQAPS
ncbi:MAG TPA: glycosyltransferase family 2 protein [Alphaproteobacteria bacterium]|nr:glycosyltransferase family 2 protein [Alphaproteobacteria bacterium]